jgi:hypothetical protein
MGRYYNGDIEGKFWFAVQNSDAADRFGVVGSTPNYLYYYFEENDLVSVQSELIRIEEVLGENKARFDEFFKKHNGYNDEILLSYFYTTYGVQLDFVEYRFLLSEYADYLLGVQIRDSIAQNGSCELEAEL